MREKKYKYVEVRKVWGDGGKERKMRLKICENSRGQKKREGKRRGMYINERKKKRNREGNSTDKISKTQTLQ